MKTLVEDNELFKFDDECEPILSVLCGKTLEHARMEVLEEEELRVMREQQQHFNDVKQAERMEADRMEQAEKRKRQDFERKKEAMRNLRKNKIQSHRKIVARNIAKKYMTSVKPNTYRFLGDVGVFVDKFQVGVMEQNVLPWLFDKVE